MADDPRREIVLRAYRRIFTWFRNSKNVPSSASSDQYRQRSQRLIERLPAPESASLTEMRAVLQEVRAGLLEWAYGQQNGEEINGRIAAAALDATGGYLTDDEQRELSSESSLWSALSAGRAAAALEESRPALEAGDRSAARQHLERAAKLAEDHRDLVTASRVALERARLADRDEARPLIESGLKLASEATPAARAALENEFARLSQSLENTEQAETNTPNDSEASAQQGVPLDIAKYEFSRSVRAMVESAATTAATLPVSTSLVLFAINAEGEPVSDPQWISDFLRQKTAPVESRFNAAQQAYLSSRGLQRGHGAASTRMTAGLSQALSFAERLALRSTGSRVIHGRHLLAALIVDLPDGKSRHGAAQRLEEAGLDVPLLREQLLSWVRGYSDNDAEWRALLGGVEQTPQITKFHADDVRGPDLLDIDRDVVALATLIAARSVTPPVSIGLFGDWGSGKTFFMRQLRRTVARLADEARHSQAMQRDEPFYKRIVQIEFNAWHYVEGNLWASLVEHLFENLHLPERASQIDEVQKHWIAKLNFAEAAIAQATERQNEAGRMVERAQVALETAKRAHTDKKDELERLSAQSVARDFQLGGAFAALSKVLKPLGLAPVDDAAKTLQGSLREARTVLVDGNVALTPLLYAPDRRARWRSLLAIAVGVPLLTGAVGLLIERLSPEWRGQLIALAGGTAAFLGSAATWLKNQVAWTSSTVRTLEDAQKLYDKELAERLAATAQQITRTEQELALTRQEYTAAQQRVLDATRERDAAATELAQATAPRLLARFIQDRAASTDYRKHLGVLALVRDDFERLSEYIEQENWKLSPADVADERFASIVKFASLEEENKDASFRINRIVLYIDDLDRCPPAKVVDVLQAVHLLLAFPLFVVVVGVDARWVTRSLWTRYRELLHIKTDEPVIDPSEMLGVARPEDYLEKIFQIPLWLEPMGPGGARKLVQGMVRSARIAASAGNGNTPPSLERSASNRGTATETMAHGQDGPLLDDYRPATLQPGSVPVESSIDSKPATAPEDVDASRGTSAVRAANVASLDIGEAEIRMIDQLSPLLGRSPRAIKRFVNVYRLVKAGLAPPELRVFMRPDEHGLATFQAALFLLAVDTGLPNMGRPLFNLLCSLRHQRLPQVTNAAAWLLAQLEPLVEDPKLEEWTSLKSWLDARREQFGSPTILRWLIEQAPIIARYSFQPPDTQRWSWTAARPIQELSMREDRSEVQT